MRALEVLGLAEDGIRLVCHDPATGEEFALPADERLRAAARGDISRLGQLEIEMDSQLRPREIQARIRAGATVEEVAAAAGTSANRIDRFAYPVLMERSAIANQAVKAHPMGPHGPAAITIGEVVTETLRSRGHTGPVDWDAFREQRAWVLAVRWKAGRSENVAHFLYHPGPDNGTVTPRGDTAVDLMDPAPKPLRTVRSARDTEPDLLGLAETQRIPKIDSTPADDEHGPEILGRESTGSGRDRDGVVTADDAGAPPVTATDRTSAAAERAPETTARLSKAERRAERAKADRAKADRAEADRAEVQRPAADDAADLVAGTVTDDRAGVHPAKDEPVARTGTDHASARPAKGGKPRRSAKPSMPSWDDVLLGSGLSKR